MPYECYYPNKSREKLQDLLTLSEESKGQIQAKEREKQRRAEAEARGDRSLCNYREVFLFRAAQKTFPVETVEVDGRWHGGAHYPLMLQMRMASARSAPSKQRRGALKKERRAQRAQEAAPQGAAAAAPEQHGPEHEAPEQHRERGEQDDSDWPAVGDGRSRRAGQKGEGGRSARRAGGKRERATNRLSRTRDDIRTRVSGRGRKGERLGRARDDIGKWESGRWRQTSQWPAPLEQLQEWTPQQPLEPPQQRWPGLQEQQPHEAPPQQRRPQTPWQHPTDAERRWESQQPSGAASSQQDYRVLSAWRDMQIAFGNDTRPSDQGGQGRPGGQGRWEATTFWRWAEYPDETNPWRQLR